MTEYIKNKIIELRLKDIGVKTIAKNLGIGRDAVRRVCKNNKLEGYRARQLLTDEDIKRRLERLAPDFEYAGGFESVDKFIYLTCRWCGYTFRHSAEFL